MIDPIPTVAEFREIAARAKAKGPIDPGVAIALLQLGGPTQEESRDWAQVPQEIREKVNISLPTYESIMAIRRLDGNTPNYVRIALTYLAICRPSNFWRIYQAKPVKYQHLHSVTGELVAIPVFPFFVGLQFRHYARLGYKAREILDAANNSIAEVDEYFQKLFSDREESRKSHLSTEEQDAEDDREEKYPYQKVGSEYQVALMKATYGDCKDLRYGEWLAFLYYAGEVRGL